MNDQDYWVICGIMVICGIFVLGLGVALAWCMLAIDNLIGLL